MDDCLSVNTTVKLRDATQDFTKWVMDWRYSSVGRMLTSQAQSLRLNSQHHMNWYDDTCP